MILYLSIIISLFNSIIVYVNTGIIAYKNHSETCLITRGESFITISQTFKWIFDNLNYLFKGNYHVLLCTIIVMTVVCWTYKLIEKISSSLCLQFLQLGIFLLSMRPMWILTMSTTVHIWTSNGLTNFRFRVLLSFRARTTTKNGCLCLTADERLPSGGLHVKLSGFQHSHTHTYIHTNPAPEMISYRNFSLSLCLSLSWLISM